MLAGLAYGAWALAAAIVVPYAGLYPSTPALLVHVLLRGDSGTGPQFWILIYASNLLVLPLAGCGLLKLREHLRRRGLASF